MFSFEICWCFYNSGAFGIANKLALAGAVSVVVPALIKLPERRDPPAVGNRNTPIVDFHRSRRATSWTGMIALFFSLVNLVSYFCLFALLDGETCKVKVTVTPEMRLLLATLYISTALSLVLFGIFYISWQDTLKREKDLSN
jgi:hypothetical protein